MYFIQPSRTVSHLDFVLKALPGITVVLIEDLDQCDPNVVRISDVHDFLKYQWQSPTVVVAFEHEGSALAEAWQLGALAGWIWHKIPKQPLEQLSQINAQYKRNQDSRDLPTAAILQKKLLPDAIDIPSYAINAFFKPSAYLSGDWYDYWKISDKEVIFYLADVSGHGVASSLLTSWMAAFHGSSKRPRELIKKLNGMLIQEDIEKHITMISGVLNFETHTLRWSSAGHYPPAILFNGTNQPTVLNTSSFALGLTEDLDIEEFECVLSKNSRFIVCSDGVLEAFEGGVNEQFKQLVKQLEYGDFIAPDHVVDDMAILSIIREK
ncbi:PP2C family protein-serine/threonine phosphatase [Acinetobacter boissieri]|uniref:Stage II sporulation protein E (SpoIIE) n=1 Tax=Acinetobacter boissieri TaxID=1219383 RepID=A0A1G6KAK5_9GAMM|nr:SpoIIE family protein phosphatase [Acinetobacter boissieri]SDC27994.1 Stage II sporulation protein E (SpoIIE) [Acinetobacter boissieri]